MGKNGIGTYVNSTRSKSSSKKGMEYIRVCKGNQRDQYVHNLVGAALLRRELRENEVVDHKDSNPFNNHPSNLRVVTVEYNSKRKYGKKHEKPDALECVLDGEDIFQREPGL